MKYRAKYAQELLALIKRLEAERYANHEQLTNMRIEYKAMISDEPIKAMTSYEKCVFGQLGPRTAIKGWKAGALSCFTCDGLAVVRWEG